MTSNPFENHPAAAQPQYQAPTAPVTDPWAGQQQAPQFQSQYPAPAQPQFTPNYQPAPPQYQAPAQNGGQQFADAPSTTPAPPSAPPSGGDPFSDPNGSTGEKISDMVGLLLLCRPLEVIASMATSKGSAENVVRCNIAILDLPGNPGQVAQGVLVFQNALKRDLADIFRSPEKTLLIGRLHQTPEAQNKNMPYFFVKATDEDKALAKQFLKSSLASAL